MLWSRYISYSKVIKPLGVFHVYLLTSEKLSDVNSKLAKEFETPP